ncbi:beta-1 3-galactosyltransferase 5 [Biomphalaria glabrata]
MLFLRDENACTYYTCLQYIKYQQSIHRPVCKIIHKGPSNKYGEDQEVNLADAKKIRTHSGCSSGPVYTKWDTCPHCFRPTVYNVSNQLRRMARNSSLFPRAPPSFFQPRKEIQQRLITKTLITPSAVCQDACPYLIAMLPSVADDYDVRDTIRATWASVAKTHLWPHAVVNADMQVIFVLANYTSDSRNERRKQHATKNKERDTHSEMTRIQTEAARYGDILYLVMHESYYNLTLKVMSAFKWIRDHCPRTKFVMKVDVDTFVSVPLLLDILIFNEERLEYSVLGYGYNMTEVIRTGKWSVPQAVWSPGIYPLYASEYVYICSMEALTAMLNVCEYVPMTNPVGAETDIPEDYPREHFVMGILGFIINYDIYLLKDIFTHEEDESWLHCDMPMDKKSLGKVKVPDDMFKLWKSFFVSYGRCWTNDEEANTVDVEEILFSSKTRCCAYVMTMSALSAIVDASRYFPIFHIEDVYITGVLRRMVELPMFLAEPGVFTDFYDTFYSHCEFVRYRRVTGTGFDRLFKYNNLWASLIYQNSTCRRTNEFNVPCACSEYMV